MSAATAIPLDLRNSGRDPEKRDEMNRQGLGVGNAGEPANTITKEFSHGVAIAFDTTQITSPGNYSVPRAGAPCHPLAAGAHPPSVAYGIDEEQNAAKELFGTLKARQAGGGFEGAVAVDCYNQTISNVAIPIRSKASDIDHTGGVLVPVHVGAFQQCSGSPKAALSYRNETAPSLTGGQDHQMCHTGMAVRRLTPRECERLQGFPDDHTLIPWRGKSPQDCPDGPRYKALGNSMGSLYGVDRQAHRRAASRPSALPLRMQRDRSRFGRMGTARLGACGLCRGGEVSQRSLGATLAASAEHGGYDAP